VAIIEGSTPAQLNIDQGGDADMCGRFIIGPATVKMRPKRTVGRALHFLGIG